MQVPSPKIRNAPLSLAALLGAFILLAAPAAAHPHVWIEARSNVVFDDQGRIIALDHRWTMDEMYTEAAVDGLDKDGDGVYSPEELAPLTKENIDSLREYDYFTALKAGDRKSAFGEVVEASQFWDNKRLTLSFRLPLKEPVDPLKAYVAYRVYDPGFFIAIEFPPQDAVAPTGSIPAGCRIELKAPVSDQQTADAKAMLATKGVDWQAPPEEDFGAMFAQPIAVACGAAPQAVASGISDLSSRSLVGPRQAGPSLTPSFWADPAAFVLATQQSFYQRISAAISAMRSGPSWATAWTLMLLSLGYGVFHAAGPGHGKTVISGWLLATEQQLRRGILISFASALIQALSAILIVTSLLFLVKAVGSTARSVASVLETASYGFIALLGFYLLWQAMGMIWPSRPALAAAAAASTSHSHEAGCTHAHMPASRELGRNWSLSKALSVSFAVGIRPCTGAILALLFANAVGVYWAGIAATFIMAIGTALTVSAIAMIAVFSKTTAMSMLGGRQAWLDWTAFGLRLGGGLLIAFLGATLFWGSLNGVATAG
jgi:ABC-type nickel/cobalt efflux system permease component RcnA/ABC-type uncharacterized transport system substrate-binding protein